MVLSLSYYNPMKITEKNYLRILGKNHEITTTDNTTKKAYNYDTVFTVKVFKKDFHVSSYVKTPTKEKVKYAKRRTIQKLTFRSMKRLRFFLRNTAYKMEYEVGLTYPNNYSNDGELVKKHFHLLRSRFNYHGYKYIWILEFQGRGAPHFHILIDKKLEKEKSKNRSVIFFKINESICFDDDFLKVIKKSPPEISGRHFLILVL